MKKFSLIIFSILGFTINCNSDDENNNSLIGKWYIEDTSGYLGKGIIDLNNPSDDPFPEKSRIIFQENDSVLRGR